MAAGAQMGRSSLFSIRWSLLSRKEMCDNGQIHLNCAIYFGLIVATNLPSNINIPLVLKPFLNPSSGLGDTESELSFWLDGSVGLTNFFESRNIVCHFVSHFCNDFFPGISHLNWGGHHYFLSWREPWHKFEDWDWFNGRNFCRDRCMDLVSFDSDDEYRSGH